MTRAHVLTVIRWMNKAGVKVDEWQFFKMAFFARYNKADVACKMCFDLYIKRGVVPDFVRRVIHNSLIVKGDVK